MKSTLRKKHLRGYTIVELLVVVVVIVILSSIALLSYNGIQDRAKYVALRRSIAAVERAFKMKAIADDGYRQDNYYQSCIG
ncbi:prepilin-type N-terminal cleavage/methylation domain-containing protein [Candidatus Nomurabacteria bacterium]|nr:prepilin-type N-terminal cleavage/methylation domain-containing protein [Candidatus Nomurabacteria bacterium]